MLEQREGFELATILGQSGVMLMRTEHCGWQGTAVCLGSFHGAENGFVLGSGPLVGDLSSPTFANNLFCIVV